MGGCVFVQLHVHVLNHYHVAYMYISDGALISGGD